MKKVLTRKVLNFEKGLRVVLTAPQAYGTEYIAPVNMVRLGQLRLG